MRICDLPTEIVAQLRRGVVIPAHPLALDADRRLDERRQRALTRYYVDAGVGGVAVGVHTTQFAIREPGVGLYEPVLELASKTVDERANGRAGAKSAKIAKIAGVCGKTEQATGEALFARDAGYHAALLSLSAFADAGVDEIVAHCREVADVLPVFGFYLQPAAGGRLLPYAFWRRFVEIENVIAIKIAPFNRYQTIDVVRAVCESGRADEIALYTGNDDNILLDLLTEFGFAGASARIVGGLLGHWAVWTKRAVELLDQVHALVDSGAAVDGSMLTRAIAITDSNAVFFDAANAYAGCIPGIHEVLRRQGLLAGTWCLDASERLSPGQSEEIDRVAAAYPDQADDDFVRENLDSWLA